MQELIGRQTERAILEKIIASDEAEMLAVIGRRRIGKTFLIEKAYEKEICFSLTGSQYATLQEQLENFWRQMQKYAPKSLSTTPPKSWQEAFFLLSQYFEKKNFKQKKVIFFDEVPWLSSPRSRFLQALAYFWNSWAKNQNLVLVICGSSSSWMIKKVLNNKGGLHNRVTRLINLQPFTLNETREYFLSRKIKLSNYQIIQLYMVMGGIPFYLKQVRPGLSATQNIDEICFEKDGLLKNEFNNLYPALFEKASNHIEVIRVLATKWKGLTRKEIVEISKLPDGGTLSKYLNELEQSGFIGSYHPFGKSRKEKLFRLTDEYSLFYLKFIENRRNQSWVKLSQSQNWKSWSGYAFESVCLKHIHQIKHALGISGISSEESSFVFHGDKKVKGFQIDLLIDRQDNTINVCEMKFSEASFPVDKKFAAATREKIGRFKLQSKTKKTVFFTLITTFGIQQNQYSLEIVDHSFNMEILFKTLDQ